MGVCWSHCNRAEQSQASTKAETANEWVSVTAFPPLALKLRICLSGAQSFIFLTTGLILFLKGDIILLQNFKVDLLVWTIKSPRWDLWHLSRTNEAKCQSVRSRFVRKQVTRQLPIYCMTLDGHVILAPPMALQQTFYDLKKIVEIIFKNFYEC